MNFKGAIGEGMLYFVFFLMIIMIIGGLYGGLNAYFGDGHDSRLEEAELLFKETKDCFVEEGFFDLTTPLDEDLFYEKCGFSRELLEDGEHMIYMKNKNGIEFLVGVNDFKIRCFLDARKDNLNLPLCFAPYELDGNYLLVGSSQSSRRVYA